LCKEAAEIYIEAEKAVNMSEDIWRLFVLLRVTIDLETFVLRFFVFQLGDSGIDLIYDLLRRLSALLENAFRFLVLSAQSKRFEAGLRAFQRG
jgi:hypothetical protein